ncbi:MFS transporter [Rhodococcus sp. NPDC127530]|uniref:MFS transporter n=1 Tax=unclassified Rhodococcus (in: high G+C Gram-positive bacteria) TaxID=192944 RepID=UPI003636B75A
MTTTTAAEKPPISSSERARVVSSTFIGTVTEWFDFYIYGIAAALYFPAIFFQNMSPTMATVASFGTLAGGFLARPIGGIIGGHFGDKYGRKKVLIVSMMTMGLATAVVGVLPGYATIGFWAPLILVVVRVIQGLGAGAEWGGGMLMLVETFGTRRRGFWGSVGVMGVSAGGVLATAVFAVVTRASDEQQEWLWRVPFLASMILVLVGLWIRVGVSETPAFKHALESAPSEPTKLPLVEVVRNHGKSLLIAICLGASHTVAYQIFVTFSNGYAKLVDVPVDTLLDYEFVMGAIGFFLVPLFGFLSDYVGRRPLMILGAAWVVPSVYFLFHFMQQGNMPMIFLFLILSMCGHSMMYGAFSALLAELFTTRTRYTGASMGYQIGGAISGLAPMAATFMLAGNAGRVAYVPLIVLTTSVLGIIAALAAREGKGKELPS